MTSKNMFVTRREKFFSKLENLGENTVAIVPAHPELIRNHDVHFKFRQDSNFFYLTGFEEPDAIAVFRAIKGKRELILFVREKDLAKEIWTGYRTGPEGAIAKYGADQAFTVGEFDKQILSLMKDANRVCYAFNRTLHVNGVEYLDQKIIRIMNEYRISLGRTGRGMPPLHDANEILGELRIFKTAEEIVAMKKAADISARAHSEIMARVKPGIYEYQVEALLEYIFMNEGCARHGYPSIVAGGSNATILHYVENNKMLKDGELLLVDAGGEFEYYSADITRTFPINGKFNDAQKEIYQIVLDIQKECIKLARPGATLANIHAFAVAELTDAMVKLKFISETKDRAIETLAYKRYYPHGTGHLLGMDVHDAGLYQTNGEPRKLEAGMYFTVEPGFYVLFDDKQASEKYRGIGVRIEDDILITTSGCDVLTSGVPKEIDEMCAIIGTKKWLSLN